MDFVLAYPQAPIECPLYMKIPKGFNVNGSRDGYVLLLLKNVYGSKAAGRDWALYLRKGLLKRGFDKSNVDDCVYYYKGACFLI